MSTPKLDNNEPTLGRSEVSADTTAEWVSTSHIDDGNALVEVHACGVCYMKYDDMVRIPKVLTCGHTYCLVCLKSISRQGGSCRISCPSCRKASSCGFRMLPNNFQLLDILSKMSLMEAPRAPSLEPISENGESAVRSPNEDGADESIQSNQDTDEFEQHRNFLLGLVDTDHSDTGESDDDDTPLFGILDLERSVDSAESLIRNIENSISAEMTADERDGMRASVIRLDGVVTDLREMEQKFVEIKDEIRDLKQNHRHLLNDIARRNEWPVEEPNNRGRGRANRLNRRALSDDGHERNGHRYDTLHNREHLEILLHLMQERRENPFQSDEDLFHLGHDFGYPWDIDNGLSSEEDNYSVGTPTIEIEEDGAFMTRTNGRGHSELVCMTCDCVVPSGTRSRQIHLQGRRHRLSTGQPAFPPGIRAPQQRNSFVDPNSDPNAPPIPHINPTYPRNHTLRGRGRGRIARGGGSRGRNNGQFRGRRAARPPFPSNSAEDHMYLGGGGMGPGPINFPMW